MWKALAQTRFRLERLSRGPDLWAKQWLDAAECFSDLQAIVYDGCVPSSQYSYADLAVLANRVARNASVLYSICRKDILATILYNCPEQVVLFIACSMLGAVFSPLPPEFSNSEHAVFVQILRPKILLLDSDHDLPEQLLAEVQCTAIALPESATQATCLWRDLSSLGPAESARICAKLDECGLIFCTSGTTAMPKCVMHSHRTIGALGEEKRANHVLKGAQIPNGPGSSRLLNSGIRGITGLYGVMTTLPYGGRLIMENVFGSASCPEVWMQLITRYQITKVVLFGGSMSKFVSHCRDAQFPSVTQVVYSGTYFPVDLVLQTMSMFPNASFTQPYSMTEVPNITVLHAHQHWRGDIDAEKRSIMSSVGAPFNSHVWIEDAKSPGSGKKVDQDEEGQVCVKSTNMMMGYYRPGILDGANRCELPFHDGSMRTGDLGRWVHAAPRGRLLLKLTGRCGDYIAHHSGRVVAPREVEEVLSKLGHKVKEFAVVGLAHPSGTGEMVAAYIVKSPHVELSMNVVLTHCHDAGLAGFRMIEHCILLEADQCLPSATGKVCRREVRSLQFLQQIILLQLCQAHLSCCAVDVVEQAQTNPEARWHSVANLVFAALLDEGGSVLDESCIRTFFGLPTCVAEWPLDVINFCRQDGAVPSSLCDGEACVSLDNARWLELVECIVDIDRTSFLVSCQSVVASLYRVGVVKRLADHRVVSI